MAKTNNDMKNMELYKTLLDQNAKVTNNLNKIETALTKLTENIGKLNDENILHHKEVSKELKIMNSWVFKIIIVLVIIIAMLAGLTSVQEIILPMI